MEVVKELLGDVEGAFINPTFYCDYGSHIEVGKNFFANYKRQLFKDEEIEKYSSVLAKLFDRTRKQTYNS